MARVSRGMALILLYLVLAVSCNDCIEHILNDDLRTKSHLEEVTAKNSSFAISSCIEPLMRRQYDKSLEWIVKQYPILEVDSAFTQAIYSISASLHQYESILKERTENTTAVQAVPEETQKVQIVAPAFQWAQSKSHVYLLVKYSAKMNSPGYSEARNISVSFTNNSVYLSADVDYDNHIIRFILNLALFKDIAVQNSTHASESVGRMYISMEKAEEGKWKRLLKSEEKPENMKLWWDMQEKYKGDFGNSSDS